MKHLLVLAFIIAALPQAPAFADTVTDETIHTLGLKEADTPVRTRADWKRPATVLVMVDKPDRLAWMQAVAPGVKVIAATTPAEAIALAPDADAIIGSCVLPVVRVATKARWFQAMTDGVEDCVTEPGIKSGHILLTNMQRVTAPVMAEHVIAMTLALSRGFPTFIQAGEREEFNARLVPPSRLWEINGRTMLVVGLGGIGTEVAKRAHALGMKVIATRNGGNGGPDFVSYVGKADELATLAPQADVVVSAVPLTPSTTNLFNAAMFARMKPGALFINVGRGESVVQDDLVAALSSGQIGGAGLDVTTPQPLPKGNPLWHAPNVIITPHVSSVSELRGDRTWIVARENLRRYAAGEKMLSVVDPARGY